MPRSSSTVTPYVIASFRHHSGRTTTAEGSNPTWNEQITLPIPLDSNEDHQNNYRSNDSLCLSLFDEVVEDLHQDDDRLRSSEFSQRIYSRWLGDIRIPFATILASQKVLL